MKQTKKKIKTYINHKQQPITSNKHTQNRGIVAGSETERERECFEKQLSNIHTTFDKYLNKYTQHALERAHLNACKNVYNTYA